MSSLRCSRLVLHFPLYTRLTHTNASGSIVLRPYQEDCIRECLDWLDQGATRLGVSLPTGSGKTTVFISLLSRLSPRNENAKRALVVVNSVELARQSAAQASRMFPDWSVEIEQGAKHKATGLADFTVATYQTLLNPERLAKFDPTKTKAIIIDEAHHAAAPSYRKLLSHFHPDVRHPDPNHCPQAEQDQVPVLGFSATFSRHDGLALGSVFERIVYHRDVLQMIDEDWLCDVRLTSVRVKLDLSSVALNKNGDFASTSLARVMNTPSMNDLVVRTWLDRAAKCKSTLIFCVNVAHVRDLTNAFRQYGVDARYLTGQTNATARKELVTSFRAGEFPVLINCAVLTEGADIPNIDCVIVARPTRSKNIFSQMIGRGLRLSPDTGKEDCHIIDYVDTVNRVSSVMSVPTLLGLDPMKLNLEDEPLSTLQKELKEPSFPLDTSATPVDVDANPGSVTYEDHESLQSLSSSLKGKEIQIRQISRFAWVTCKKDTYVLQSFSSVKVKISRSKDPEQPFDVKIHRYIFRDGRRIEVSMALQTASSLEDAVHGADTYIQEKLNIDWQILLHTAPWRKKPPTATQVKQIMGYHSKTSVNSRSFLSAIGLKLGEDQDEPTAEQIEDRIKLMKRGQLFDAITRLKHRADKKR